MLKTLFLLIFCSVAWSQTTYHVTGVSSPPTTYAGVQEAIDSIPADLSGLGVQTVQIDSGFYNESLVFAGFSNASAADYIHLKPTDGEAHKGDSSAGVKISGTANPMVSISVSFLKISDIVFIQEGTATSSTIQTAGTAGSVLFERLFVVRNGNGFIVTYGVGTDFTIRSSILISNYTGTGTFSCLRLGNSSIAENVTIWSDGAQNGATGCAASVELDGTGYAKNVVAFGKTPTFGHFKDDGGSAETDYNFSTDGSAPGANSLINQASADLQFVDTANWDLHIGDSSLSVISEAGVDLSSNFGVDIDSTCFNTLWAMGAHDLNVATDCDVENINMSSPANYYVDQMNGSDSCTFVTGGTYSGDADTLQYRIGYTQDWAQFPVSGGSFNDSITTYKGGKFLFLRDKADTTVLDSQIVGCGHTFVMVGESNTVGQANTQATSTETDSTFVGGCGLQNYGWKKWDDPARKPSDFKGGWQPQFGSTMAEELGVPIGIVSPAEFNHSMVTGKDWAPGGAGFDTLMVMKASCPIDSTPHIVYLGGEEDAWRVPVDGLTTDSLMDAYDNFIQDYNDSVTAGATAILAQIGHFGQIASLAAGGDSSGIDTVRWAGLLTVSENASWFAGPSLYDIDLVNDAGDSIHYGYSATNGDVETDTVASRMVRSVLATWFSGTDANPPFVSYASIIDNQTVQIGFTVGSNKLIANGDIEAAAFRITDDTGLNDADSVTIFNDTAVQVHLNRAIDGDTIDFSLASKNYGTEINLTDSADLGDNYNMPPEPCFFYQLITGTPNTQECFEGSIIPPPPVDTSSGNFGWGLCPWGICPDQWDGQGEWDD